MIHRAPIDPQKVYAHLKDKVQWALCDKCGWNWPEGKLRVHAGVKVCQNHPEYEETTEERTDRYARAASRLKGKEQQPKYPHAPEMRGVPGVTRIEDNPMTLSHGGSKFQILTGVNLSHDDTITFSSSSVEVAPGWPSYTAIDPDTHANQCFMIVQAPVGAVNGNYDLIYNGDVYPGVYIVRG